MTEKAEFVKRRFNTKKKEFIERLPYKDRPLAHRVIKFINSQNNSEWWEKYDYFLSDMVIAINFILVKGLGGIKYQEK